MLCPAKKENPMRVREVIGLIALIATIGLAVLIARGAETRSGTWALMKSDEPGMIRFALMMSYKGGHSNDESDWALADFQGLDLATASRHDVKFTISRDAGKFEGEGFVENGEGAGIFVLAIAFWVSAPIRSVDERICVISRSARKLVKKLIRPC